MTYKIMINQLQKEIQLQLCLICKKKIFYQKLTFFTQISKCSTDTILHHPDSELAGQIHLETTKIFHAVLISIYLGNSAGLFSVACWLIRYMSSVERIYIMINFTDASLIFCFYILNVISIDVNFRTIPHPFKHIKT